MDEQSHDTPSEQTPQMRTAVRPAEQVDESPPRVGEVIGVLLLVVLSDQVIYRGHGFCGLALLFAAAPLLMWLGSSRRRFGFDCALIAAMLVLLAVKMIWCGSWLLTGAGFALVVAYAVGLSGSRPYVPETVFRAAEVVRTGYDGWFAYARAAVGLVPSLLPRTAWVSVLMPIAALIVFGWLFVLANPDLVVLFSERLSDFFAKLNEWVLSYFPDSGDLLFWFASAWIVIGLLRPLIASDGVTADAEETREVDAGAESADAFLYPGCRNTMLTLISLFAVYLVFEFKTLWFRRFPEGFHYSGYAHEGAAWLTVALALATVVLSLVFRGNILLDPRLPRLRRLAWIWSAENFLLALAVYNRLFIYIGYNGMTRMRIVGLYGITSVVIGFVFVLWKIAQHRRFLWLIRRQMWTLAFIVYLFALTPLDWIVVNYNVSRVLAGDQAPSVQICVHPINSEGVTQLMPLLDADNEIIREGVRALLAEHHSVAEATEQRRQALGWTTYQHADSLVLAQFREHAEKWAAYRSQAERREALDRFYTYTYQWY